jgi:hypothetical protein
MVKIYISIDGDNIGKKIEKYILNEDLLGMKEFSYQIAQSIRTFERVIKETGGDVYISGGDNILAFVKDNYVNNIIQLVNELNSKKTFSFSVGLAYTIQDVYLALKYCKSISAGKIIMAIAEHGKMTFKPINGDL